jgi:heat shock protein HtpX
MFNALPKETVFEAQRRARRATGALFVILLVIYAVFFNLLLMVTVLVLMLVAAAPTVIELARGGLWRLNVIGLLVGAAVAFVQYVRARFRKLDALLPMARAVPLDAADRYHRRFRNLVEEAEVATGLRPIRAMVIPSTGLNACSLRTRDGTAICATEGIVSRLTRQELAAVVAHEAGRLVSDDSRLATTACGLVNVFGGICGAAGKSMEVTTRSYDHRQKGFHPLVVFIWAVAAVGHGVLSLVYMALSRDRGYQADAQAVQMCKDPLALADAISRMSSGYRGCGDVREGYEALFMVDPRHTGLSESEGLIATIFTTHPPLKRRLRRLLAWAKADVSALRPAERSSPAPVTREPTGPVLEEALPDKGEEFFVNHDGLWRGPYLPQQMLALGILSPRTWVAVNLADGPIRASDHPALLPLFELKEQAAVSDRRCPRCGMPLAEREYEGAPVLGCAFCGGYLLRAEVITRIIARRERHFTSKETGEARRWRSQRRGRPAEVCGFPDIKCPACGRDMAKRFHSVLVKVVLDFCTDPECGRAWADGGELEHIQVIVQDASAGKP